ncbi:MAG: YIP1 family protein [Desulfovibrio sp.]
MTRENILLSSAVEGGTPESGNIATVDTSKFFQTLTELIRAPRQFYAQLEDTPENYKNSWRFLAYASLFYAVVSITYFFDHKLAMIGILLLNAMVLPAILAAMAMLVMSMFLGVKVPFRRIFSIYAFASGAVMPVSWIPALQVFTEPIRALLVGIGMVKACGLRWWQAAIALLVSVGLYILLFWSALPVIMQVKEMLLGA